MPMIERRIETGTRGRSIPGRRRRGDSLPFALTEELLHFIDRPDEPATIQLELGLSGTIDLPRLQAAFARAVTVHPMAQVSKASGRRLLSPARWRIDEPRAVDAVSVTACGSDDELSAVRNTFYSRSIGLQSSPALRLLLVRRRRGTSLLLSINHAIMDGVGALRFLHSVARSYRNRPDPILPIDPLALRELGDHFGTDPTRPDVGAGHVAVPTGVCSLVFDHPNGTHSLIAPDRRADEPGYGFVLRTVPSSLVRPLESPTFAPSATINDWLLAGLHLAIESWNSGRGRPSRRLASLMPVNLRPSGWRHEVAANLLTSGLIVSTPEQRSCIRSLLPALARQTRRVKSGLDLSAALNPPFWKRLLSVALIAARGARDSSVAATLSNLGQIDAPPDFGDEAGSVTEVWFSPPAPMPMGLALGVVGRHEELQLVLRYRRALFSKEAAEQFARTFVDHLEGLGRGSGPGIVAPIAVASVPSSRRFIARRRAADAGLAGPTRRP